MQGYRGLKKVPDSAVNSVWLYLISNYLIENANIYMRTIYSSDTSTLAFDATHRFAEKGKIINSNNQRISPMKSLLVVVDNRSYIVAHAFTTDQGNAQIKEVLEGIAKRMDIAKVCRTKADGTVLKGSELIERIGSDYVEKYQNMTRSVFKDSIHQQDRFHFQQLLHYAVCNSSANPQYKAV